MRVAAFVLGVAELLSCKTSTGCNEEVVDVNDGDLVGSPSVSASLFAKAAPFVAAAAPRAVRPMRLPVILDLCLVVLGGDDGVSKGWCFFSSSSRGLCKSPWAPGDSVVLDLVFDVFLHRLVDHRRSQRTLTALSCVETR